MTALKISKSSLAIAIILGLSPPLAIGQDLINRSAIKFDITGGGGGVTVDAFDWLQSSAVVTNLDGDAAIPLGDTTGGDPVKVFAHSKISSITINGKKALIIPSETELTFIIGMGVLASQKTQIFTDDTVDLKLNPAEATKFFAIYQDDTTSTADGTLPADPLEGTGYNDGTTVLTGKVIQLTGNFQQTENPAQEEGVELMDQSTADDWNGIQSIIGGGGQVLVVQVDNVNKDFIPEGLDTGSLIVFNNSQILPFKETDPSRRVSTDLPPPSMLYDVDVGVDSGSINGDTGPDLLLQIDPNQSFSFLSLAQGCRVTAGGNDTAGIDDNFGGWDESEASGKDQGQGSTNEWRFGGQAGANTAGSATTQARGEWTHTNTKGPSGRWTFHAGTASAPVGTEITQIICSDPGSCFPARPAPTKQIDFNGIGTFKNDGKGQNFKFNSNIDIENAPSPNVTPGETHHYFEVHMEDLGEPGKEGQHTVVDTEENCPAEGSGTDAFAGKLFDGIDGAEFAANCECPDFYRIRIYQGFDPSSEGPNTTDLIYEVDGYIDGGNIQIHPPTGFDLKGR